MRPFFYVLKGLNPFEHLAAEDFLLRSRREAGMAVWVSRPCVVLGRFQNPWQEVYWQKLKSKDVWIVRRQSGGGTVYHDQGNLNFAFFGELKDLSKKLNLSLVQKALRLLGLNLQKNDRHDLFYQRGNQFFKVSGNAFKQTQGRFLHHGTLLVNSRLEILKELLHPPDWGIQSKAVSSRRSPVANLNDLLPINREKLAVKDVVQALLEVFKNYWYSRGIREWQIEEVYSRVLSPSQTPNLFVDPQWIWGETPPFSWKWGEYKFSFTRGRIKEIEGPAPVPSPFQFLRGKAPWEGNFLKKEEFDSLATLASDGQLQRLKDFWGPSQLSPKGIEKV